MASKSPTPRQSDGAWRGIITLLYDQENAESQKVYSKWQFLRPPFQRYSILHVDRDINYLSWGCLMFSSISMFKYTRMLSLQEFEVHQTQPPNRTIRHQITSRSAKLSLNILETIHDNTVFYETISNLDYIASNIWASDKRFLEMI